MRQTVTSRSLKHIASWFLAAFILGYLFWKIDIELFKTSIEHANISLYLPLMILFIFIWFFIESQNLVAMCRHFGHDLSYKQSIDIRGVTYLLMIVNPFLGMGGIAYYLKKDLGITLMRASSLMIFYSYSEMISLLSLSSIGACFVFRQNELFLHLLYISTGALLCYNIFLVIVRALPPKGIVGRLKNVNVWKPFFEAQARTLIVIPLWRGLYFFTFIVFFYYGLKTFHIHVPLLHLFVYVPFIFGIGGLPVTPFGLGTIQAAMVFFFKAYSSEANVMAFSVTYSTCLLLLRMPIGLFYLRKYGSDLKIPVTET
jgi:uncharacterized membrane protein YbhN (UPF0104 family)